MTLDEMIEQMRELAASATHLLLIAPTKYGKTDYVAQAAIDGWTILYFDRDNGLQTLMARLKGNPEAMQRVHYFNPLDFFEFMSTFITSANVVRYDSIKRGLCTSSASATPGATITEIYPLRIPRNVIVVLDSWTSLAFSAIEKKADDLSIDLMDSERYGREIYGSSGFKLTQIAKSIQASPNHWIVQGHPGFYERKEKPQGTARNIDEKDMIIKETREVLVSSSLPHGASLGQYFNEIGHIIVDGAGNRKLDFRVRPDRMGGGTTTKGQPPGLGNPRELFSFNNLFGPVPEIPPNPERPWLRTLSTEAYKAEAAAKHANAPRLTTTGIAKPPAAQVPVQKTTLPAGLRKQSTVEVKPDDNSGNSNAGTPATPGSS